MKKIILGFLTGLLVIASLSACSGLSLPAQAAADKSNIRTINVSGQGQVFLTPDVAYVYIGVHSQSASVTESLKENNTQATAVSDALKELGVDPKDIQTTSFNVYPMQQYGQQGEITGTLYSVDNTVYVTVRNLDMLGQILDAVVRSGANSINGITFDVMDKEQAMSNARKLAIENARKQAEEIALATGVTLGPLMSININTGTPIAMYEGKGGGGMAAAPLQAPVSAGQLVLTVDANLSYEIK